MVSRTFIFAIGALVATSIDYVQAHGYIISPPLTWRTKPTSYWVTEINPLWKGDWEDAHSPGELLALFNKLAVTNHYNGVLRELMDDPKFGPDCGFTNPKGKPVDPPPNNTAMFSRPLQHPGQCEIWLDDKRAFKSNNCMDDTGPTRNIFKPVDYSLCPVGGCEFKFYWLGLQYEGKPKWQSYKNCASLTGPPKGASSKKPNEDVSQTEVSMDSSGKTQSDGKTDDTSTKKSDKDTSKTPSPSESDGKNDNASTKKSDKDTSKTPSLSESDGKNDNASTKKSDKDTSKTPSLFESDGKNDNASTKKSDKDTSKTPSPSQSDGKTEKTPASKSDKDTLKTPSPSQSDGKTEKTPASKSDKDTLKTPSPLPETPAPSPEMSPAPSSKCKGRRRRLDPQ